MSNWVMYSAVILTSIAALAGTVWVGYSRENKEGNPTYEKNTKPNVQRLLWLYILATVVFVILTFWIMALLQRG